MVPWKSPAIAPIPRSTPLYTVYIIAKHPAARSYPLPIHAAGHLRLNSISAPSAFRSWLAIRRMVAPLPWLCSSCSIMVSPAMTIFLFWNKRSSTTPPYSMSSSGVFLCLDRGVLFGTRSGWSWNATPFWQPKIQSSNGVHHVGSLVSVNTNAPYFDWNSFFNCVNPDRTTACDTIRRADAYQRPHNPHCTTISSDHTQTQALIYQSSINFY